MRFLHSNFINSFSGAGRLDSTLRELGRRKLTLGGQLFEPQDDEARLCITTKMAQKQLENRAFGGPPTKPSRHKFLLIALKSITVTVDCPQPQS